MYKEAQAALPPPSLSPIRGIIAVSARPFFLPPFPWGGGIFVFYEDFVFWSLMTLLSEVAAFKFNSF
jgi:hypothetical protein